MSTLARFAALAFLAAALALPTLVAAQTTTPADVVRLHDGTFLRGTLVERSPTQVVVVLQTGETRTYPASAVEYAGPDAPPAPTSVAVPPAPIAPAARVARLHVSSDQSELSLQRLQGSAAVSSWNGHGMTTALVDQFGILCNVPCDLEVPEGAYQLGVAKGVGAARRAGSPMDLRGDMALRVGYEDHSATRGTGWLIFGIGSAVGAGLMMGSIWAGPEDCSIGADYCHSTMSLPMMIVGSVIWIGGVLAGLVFLTVGDAATIEVEPAAARF